MVDFSKFFSDNDIVAVALSGGRDSMALLHMLTLAMPKSRIKAINVEHGIRGESSVADTSFVKNYCKVEGIELKCYSADVPAYCRQTGTSEEEGARQIRYAFFKQALQEGFCTKIATAHHLSDSVETVLFNLFRGAGTTGGSGIGQNNNIIRPLLTVSREEIDLYVEKNNICYVEDETNTNTKYTRNYIRNEIIPLIKKAFPEGEKAIMRFSEICAVQDQYITAEAEKLLDVHDDEISFPENIERALKNKCVILALKKMGMEKDYELKHAKETEKLLCRKNGDVVDFPKGIKAVKDYGKITFFKQSQVGNFSIPFNQGKTEVNGKTVVVEKFHNKQKLWFDLDKLPSNCEFRSRREGDVFKPFGSGEKKLKKYLIDKKIPSRVRDKQILVASGNEVYIIIGLEISDKIKTDGTTKNAYTIYIRD